MTVKQAGDAVFKASVEPDVVVLPARIALIIEGQGPPAGEAFQRSVEALYGVAYTLKFQRKHFGRGDVKIGPLEGDWWINAGVDAADQTNWRWRLRIVVPDDVKSSELERAIAQTTAKRGGKLYRSAEAARVTIRRSPRKRVGRILHIGPYANEKESIDRLESLLQERRLHREPWHTEIYLSDPRRTTPEKLKTVLLVDVNN